VVSDGWEGLDEFFEPDREIIIVRTAEDVIEALSRTPTELRHIGEAARVRALEEHTARDRAQTLVELLAGTPACSTARSVSPEDYATLRRA
jgi:spore maturation protein CgeB